MSAEWMYKSMNSCKWFLFLLPAWTSTKKTWNYAFCNHACQEVSLHHLKYCKISYIFSVILSVICINKSRNLHAHFLMIKCWKCICLGLCDKFYLCNLHTNQPSSWTKIRNKKKLWFVYLELHLASYAMCQLRVHYV